MKTVPLTQARYNLRDLTHRAQAGDVFVITDRGKEVAAVTSLAYIEGKRRKNPNLLSEIDHLRAKITREVRRRGIKKTSTELLRELREESSHL